MPGLQEGVLTIRTRDNFAGGVNVYIGPRQIKDNESPEAINCDFKGKGGVGNRTGYTQIGAVADSRTEIWGMTEYHTASLDQLIKFASNGSNIALYYSTGGAWTAVTGTTFADNLNLDAVEANSLLYSFNGSNVLREYNGTSWAATTNGKILKYGAYYDKRLWGVDPNALDTLYFSKQSTADFVAAGTGSVTIFPGSGAEIKAIKVFRDALYVFLNGAIKGIFEITPATAADTFTVTMITNTLGAVSHRSVAQIENDLYFASDDGVYSLGEVAQYTSIRTTNKSLRVQGVFDALSGASRGKLVGRYFNFKYHLFYPLYGGENDSCLVFDIRYQGWQDWRSIAAQDATTYTDSTNNTRFFFGEPSTGEVHELYEGSTDDGTAISSSFTTKSYDEKVSDLQKLYLDSTFTFGDLGASVTATVIFNDSETSATKTITTVLPQGGFGRDAFGVKAFGGATQNNTITAYVNTPLRLRAKGQKFAIQYKITSTGTWRLDSIGQSFIPFSYWKFPSANKIT